MSGRDVGPIFEALADATRREVIRRIADRGETTATEIASGLEVTRQAVAKHLSALGQAGLVAGRREGREVRYHLTPGPLTEAMGWMADVGAAWDARLEALRSQLTDGS